MVPVLKKNMTRQASIHDYPGDLDPFVDDEIYNNVRICRSGSNKRSQKGGRSNRFSFDGSKVM